MNEAFARYIEKLAYQSMIYEVSASPKPGLVDQRDSGAHQDMDYHLFLTSAKALRETFYRCTRAGLDFTSTDYPELLSRLRPIGINGEKTMFEATQGVNTHKGLIFSLGIISAAAGSLFAENGELINRHLISERVIGMTKDLTENDFKLLDVKNKLTYGELQYKKYGVKGIRGEAESGYESVLKHSLPYLEYLLNDKMPINDALVNCLILLMTEIEDINILGRHDDVTLQRVKDRANEILKLKGMESSKGRALIKETNVEFIQKNISPGGSADLLAVTIMFYMLEKGEL